MIVLDVQALQSPAYATRGVGRYVADLVRTLEREHPGTVDRLVWNDRLPRGDVLDALDAEVGLGARLVAASALRGRDVAVLHVPAPFAPLARAGDEATDFVDWTVPVRARRSIVTVYDLIPWRHPDAYLRDANDRARYHHRLAMLLAADEVLAVSESAAADVMTMVGVDASRVTVVGAGPSERFVPPTDAPHERLARLASAVPRIGPGYVLVVGAPDWRKNLDGALDAYARLPAPVRAAHQLVVAAGLSGAAADEARAQAIALGIDAQVLIPGFVDDAVLVALYQTADVVVVPSRVEGFGLPVLEARACGARVICSDASSLPEVLPDHRARFDPDDPGDIARCLLAALTEPEYQAVLDGVPPAPYSWSTTAALTVEAYRRPPSGVRRPARMIAVATNIPPTASGVADHSERLVAALAAIADVEVFSPAVPHTTRRAPQVPVHPLVALPGRWADGSIAHVVYCLGNGVVHRPLVDMMRVVPGAAFLHEVRLPYLHGRRPVASPDGDIAAVVSTATAVLVQSAHAAELLHARVGAPAVDIGPHPCWNDGSAEHLDDGGAPWVVNAGIAHEAKQTDRFAAAARLLAERRSVRTALVGDGGERFVRPDDDIIVTGHVGAADFDTWLRRASLLVQLRAATNGESSGVVAHAMARGVPLVVTDIGAMREIPEDVAVRVPVDVTPEALCDVVDALLDDPDRLAAMREAGLAFAARETAAAQAQRLVEALATIGVSR